MGTEIRNNLNYLRYAVFHKWYVFLEAWKLGIVWRGLLHDWSKFSWQEWRPRVAALARRQRQDIYTPEFFAPGNVEDELALSWLRHYHRNPHHWQWWIVVLDGGQQKVLPMTDEYRREMLADWRAVSRMPDRMAMVPWYLLNREKIILHPETRQWVEKQLGLSETGGDCHDGI
ncbi:Hypothetical protein LUCI_1524 [Lucifera butyrica]|uniref:Uncharacterized protein n=1 Tax=Lucifera butyrica TaxID=1351585 RepID=A0A498R5A7_9FIRM|nr:DUF5662 family protein [Lucifera butyrica]VBB06295.1 Hypothetical protein LUCI_1524 [Lucifera butyrica]